MPLLGVEHRVTLDIDIAPCQTETSQKAVIQLMEIATGIGLPVEAINQAAAYFLEKIPNWRQNLVLVHTGPRSKFFRPNLGLFLRLKLARFSESDLLDCINFLKIRYEEAEELIVRSLLAELKVLSKNCHDQSKIQRYLELEKNLKKFAKKAKKSEHRRP